MSESTAQAASVEVGAPGVGEPLTRPEREALVERVVTERFDHGPFWSLAYKHGYRESLRLHVGLIGITRDCYTPGTADFDAYCAGFENGNHAAKNVGWRRGEFVGVPDWTALPDPFITTSAPLPTHALVTSDDQ